MKFKIEISKTCKTPLKVDQTTGALFRYGGLLTGSHNRNNKKKSRIRVQVEHAFGRIAHLGGDRFRRIGKRRCRFEKALTNLTYNLDRFAMFHRPA
ncbi:MAG: hypothetical protein AAFX93_16375 [Verrucomicrobiota bacterium]